MSMGWRRSVAVLASVAGPAHGLLRRASIAGVSFLLTVGPVAVAEPLAGAGVVASARVLTPDGVGPVHFGTAKAKAVRDLSDVFGRPSAQGTNTGCGPRYNEVEWGELVAEFRSESFSGYRYLKGGWPLTASGSPLRLPPSQLHGPRLATTKGISLESMLGRLRSTYGELRFVGVDKWQAANGIVFVVNAPKEPEPSSSKVVEIKLGTCGDF